MVFSNYDLWIWFCLFVSYGVKGIACGTQRLLLALSSGDHAQYQKLKQCWLQSSEHLNPCVSFIPWTNFCGYFFIPILFLGVWYNFLGKIFIYNMYIYIIFFYAFQR